MLRVFEDLRPDLFLNLAREEVLVSGGEGVGLMLWRGPGAVVLGKNQNPWRECNLEVIEERGLGLGRRISGGGSVYHDPGNLNFSWVLPRAGYAAEEVHGVLRDALGMLGVRAEVAPTGGMLVEGRKVSGAAYCYRQERVLHHGTLLWDADLGALRAALSPARLRVRTHAVGSVPARVMNVAERVPGGTLADAAGALRAAAERRFGAAGVLEFDGEAVAREAERLRSREWIWGQTPQFSVLLGVGGAEVELVVRRGRVVRGVWGGVGVEFAGAPWFGPGMEDEVGEALGVEGGGIRGALAAGGWIRGGAE